MKKILFVLSSATHWILRDGTQHPTGFWAEELVTPHKLFRQAGYQITLATPDGALSQVDPLSLSLEMNGGNSTSIEAFRDYLETIKNDLKAPKKLSDLQPSDYDAMFIPGGHGPMQDLANDVSIGQFLIQTLEQPNVILASVCHGPASFLTATRADGTWAFAGRRLTAFLNLEETQVGFASVAPWLLEDRLRQNGAHFEAAKEWSSHIVTDGNLITGQNPASADAAARAVIAKLNA